MALVDLGEVQCNLSDAVQPSASVLGDLPRVDSAQAVAGLHSAKVCPKNLNLELSQSTFLDTNKQYLGRYQTVHHIVRLDSSFSHGRT